MEYVFRNYDRDKWSHSSTDIRLQSGDSNENEEEEEEENTLISMANITSENIEKSNKESSTKSHLFESKILNEDSKDTSPPLSPNLGPINKKKESVCFRINKKEKEGTILAKINKMDSDPDLLKRFNDSRRLICPDLKKRRDYLGLNLFDFGFEKPKEYNVFFPKDNLNNVLKKLQKFLRAKEKKKRKNR